MEAKIEVLEWDSDFFGIRVGKLRSNGSLPEVRFEEFDLVYVFSEAPIPHEITEKYSLISVDRKLTFSCRVDEDPGMPGGIRSYIAGAHDTTVIALGIQSGVYSRFKIDPNFEQDWFEKLFTTWMRRSIDREIADEVYVCVSGGEPRGVITLGNKSGRTKIGIIAVDDEFRGRRIGHKLVQAAKHYTFENGSPELEVVTQEDNEAACRFYEHCGFSVKKREYIYHYWNKIRKG